MPARGHGMPQTAQRVGTTQTYFVTGVLIIVIVYDYKTEKTKTSKAHFNMISVVVTLMYAGCRREFCLKYVNILI